MIISNDDGSEGHMTIFSNQIKSEPKPPNPYWLTSELDTKHGAFEKLFKPNKHWQEKKFDYERPLPPIDWHGNRFEPDILNYDNRVKIDWNAIKSIETYYANHVPRLDTRIVTNDFKPYMPKPAVGTGTVVFRAFAGVMGAIVVMMFIARVCGKKSNRSSRDAVEAARAAEVQQYLETLRASRAKRLPTTRAPPAQGDNPRQFTTGQISGADPPSSDVPPPYSECVNHTVSEQPPSYTNLTDTQPPVHNGPVEIGFKYDCVAMTSTPSNSEDVKTELVFENGRIVERLSLDLSKEAGQGAKHSDVTEKVVYVDVHSYSKAVLE